MCRLETRVVVSNPDNRLLHVLRRLPPPRTERPVQPVRTPTLTHTTSFPGPAFYNNVLTPTSPPGREQALGNPAVVLIHGRGSHFVSSLPPSLSTELVSIVGEERKEQTTANIVATLSRTCECCFLFVFAGARTPFPFLSHEEHTFSCYHFVSPHAVDLLLKLRSLAGKWHNREKTNRKHSAHTAKSAFPSLKANKSCTFWKLWPRLAAEEETNSCCCARVLV